MNSRVGVSFVLFLNVLLGVLVVTTPTNPLLAVQARGEQEVRVWLRSASRDLTLETGEKAQFAVQFGEMGKKVCPGAHDHAFVLLCSHISSLELLSPVYLLFSCLILLCVLCAFLHLSPLLSNRKPMLSSLSFTHYVTGPLSLALVFSVLHLLQKGDWQPGDMLKQEQSAFYTLLLTSILGILSSSAYSYVSYSGLLSPSSDQSLLVSYPPSSSQDSSNMTLLKSQLEHYKTQLHEAEVTNQRYHLLKVQHTDLQAEYEVTLTIEGG